ncbi:MAG TPA: response regulator transcription factor [Aggregatilineales bacterium]|nr:response regulator transcription factor [Anaerolineales bacterium]HRE49426.1 response regulator transcription factor [Aggregatilineales bacterium]
MSKKRLLLIEDDFDVSEMLLAYFSAQGYDMIHAQNGSEGVSLARAKSPNLILLDVMLPDMDGFDVCRQLRGTLLTKHIPITFLTQRDRRADKVAGLELGADDYITKPFDIDELKLRVAAQLRRAGRESIQDAITGLPTNEVIDEVYNALQMRDGWTHLRLEIYGFNAFRSNYGFLSADDVLGFTGTTLREGVIQYGTPEDFVGKRTETKYTVFTFSPDPAVLMKALQTTFTEGVKRFYTFSDVQQGYIVINEARDDEQHIPLMRLGGEIVKEASPFAPR